jgi:parallel beta-helix repeat protein
MPSKRFATLSFSLALGLAGVVALLWLPALSKVEGLGGSRVALAQAGTGIIRVATTGSDTPSCGSQATPCRTVQYAVDQAQAGEEVRVAAGLYTDLQGRAAPGDYLSPPASGVITQVVYISKTVTIWGGYTTAFSDPPDPETNQTTLDAQGGGRVLFIADPSAGSGPAISPTVEGLRLTNGDAAGLGGTSWGDDYGGGVYVVNATATISNNRVFSNTADGGGGLYLFNSDTTLSGNTVASNTADGYGGGLSLRGSDATLSGNTVTSNTADGPGGGLYLIESGATLSGNTVISNTADDYGGGLYLRFSDATLSRNTVISNTVDGYGGGGLSLYRSDATLTNNVVTDNDGSGLYIWASSPRLLHTTIARNSGSSGVFISDDGPNYSTVALTNTILVSHTVGIYVRAGNTATLESTLWHGNTTDWDGTGTINRSNDYAGDPLFDADGYHLMAGSAAIDKGVDAGVMTDIDGDPRDSTPDLGADERVGAGLYLPIILKNH